jgi:hypothetical protein
MTPFEIGTRLEGARERLIERRRFEASMVAALMNVEGRVLKSAISGDELLGLKKKRKGLSRGGRKFLKRVETQRRAYADYLAELGE